MTTADAPDLVRLAEACDRSVRTPALRAIGWALLWLALGSLWGDLASLKLHWPDLLSGMGWLTFGRIRPAHLNAMIYGFATNTMFAVSLWLMSRLVRQPLLWPRAAQIGIWIWNIGLIVGLTLLLVGRSDGMEWLELDRRWADPLLLIGAAGVGASVLKTLSRRNVHHLYVSVWYVAAAFIWFPVIFVIGNWPFRGIENAAANWFYAHNALGLWLTAIGLGAIYYLIPKVLGRPIYSYWLSLVGFWSLAFFYSLNGMHHLIGGPLPSWMIATSIVASLMMVIPVIAVAVNHHMTMVGRFSALRYSPTLTFIVLGAMAYTGVSLQGVMQSLVEVNRITHFTHWTIGHAHMGVYGFVTLTLFGSLYYMLPRLLQKEWVSARLIRWHFWLVMIGLFLYVFGLGLGGVFQGLALNDPRVPFSESVRVALPALYTRSFAGLLLTLGHFTFIVHVLRVWRSVEAPARRPAWHEIRPIVVDAPFSGATVSEGLKR